MTILKKPYLVIYTLISHSAIVLLLYCAILSSTDPEASMAWIVMWVIDFPISYLLQPNNDVESLLAFFVAGGLQWAVVVISLQVLVSFIVEGSLPKRPTGNPTEKPLDLK